MLFRVVWGMVLRFVGIATQLGAITAKAKYRDLSTAAAKYAAFGRDDVCWWGEGRRTGNYNGNYNCNYNGKCNGKYRDLSTAAANAPPSV